MSWTDPRPADVDDVVAYLAAEDVSLPRIAVRETHTKLRTGTRTARRST